MKLVSILGLLVAAAFVRHIPVLAGLYLGTLALAVASGLSLGFFVKRVICTAASGRLNGIFQTLNEPLFSLR